MQTAEVRPLHRFPIQLQGQYLYRSDPPDHAPSLNYEHPALDQAASRLCILDSSNHRKTQIWSLYHACLRLTDTDPSGF